MTPLKLVEPRFIPTVWLQAQLTASQQLSLSPPTPCWTAVSPRSLSCTPLRLDVTLSVPSPLMSAVPALPQSQIQAQLDASVTLCSVNVELLDVSFSSMSCQRANLSLSLGTSGGWLSVHLLVAVTEQHRVCYFLLCECGAGDCQFLCKKLAQSKTESLTPCSVNMLTVSSSLSGLHRVTLTLAACPFAKVFKSPRLLTVLSSEANICHKK